MQRLVKVDELRAVGARQPGQLTHHAAGAAAQPPGE
jgi:hypothetical protein